ncbi:hypothetical protein JRQ81_013524 [Phrynocephalus forsythii]|uniref:Uncharacterized protein n=1 Tax=Phrynocephalus forsythii TaxID=171643 RepID=A0A9Q1B444_9SAUR|nr:hypothetical protein JRQ81_013524 [Phrynocephalus forsythii]
MVLHRVIVTNDMDYQSKSEDKKPTDDAIGSGINNEDCLEIKVKHSWVEGPCHMLFQLQLLRLQRKAVVDAVLPTVQCSALVLQ